MVRLFGDVGTTRVVTKRTDIDMSIKTRDVNTVQRRSDQSLGIFPF